MLLLENLTIGNARRPLVQNISARIARGRLVCLIGRNGVGKSTLLRTIAGFQPSLGGSVVIDSRQLADYSREQLARLVGIVLTERPRVQFLTLRQMVRMGRIPYAGFFRMPENDEPLVDAALKLMEIELIADKPMDAVSDGELQKAMIARVLVQQTPLILMDEPTAFLDFRSKVELLKVLHGLAHEQEKAILVTTHDLSLALRIADEIWLMTDDRIIPSPSKQEILDFVGPEAASFL